MRIFIAGATGALGSRLVPLLTTAGHEVFGTSRNEAGRATIDALGATGIVMDPLDVDSVHAAVAEAKPDVVVHQLTALSALSGNMKKWDQDFAMTNRLRIEGTDHLLAAARASGVRRFVAQSYGGHWTNERTGGPVKTEADPLVEDPGKEARQTLRAIKHVEEAVMAAPGIEGVVLRYGNFYGPGNALSRDGEMGEMVRRAKFPVVGGGGGVWSWIHIDDAATATVAAIERGEPGIYNVVDDDPAPLAEWLPYLAEQLDGKKPMRLPAWLARPLIGQFGLALMTTVRGSSNAKARRELDWAPQLSSWREGFRTGIG
ncbi:MULTISPECIES: NAD-dependent epimerase/dehydratase family protein [unclassified Nocardioides]|uniref:NAD-dependent epimerase/dehydratase family protein n=1 Tax=unclassified Nocardioides TaxID=2615069 RepID=UPI0006F6593F|nr:MULTISPECIES: NAD(P)-dependent oxidoreductase [unclassified Nocardioides]KRA39166.1 dehydrogenase [Nocardioides sp. Root614]KRA93125.1 dehydrogenase [Nocardioides sp. Root682]